MRAISKKIVSKSFFMFLAVSIVTVFSTLSFAGRYIVEYSGGESYIEIFGQGTRSPYRLWASGYGFSASIRPGRVYIEGSGTIAATFTWDNQGNPCDTPPASVVVEEYCRAGWGANAGSCDNGLGHPELNRTSEGYRYSIVDQPGLIFTVNCTPSVTAQNTGTLADTNASIAYRSSATPVVLNVAGVVEHNDECHALIGQGLRCSLSASGYRLENHRWSASGSHFGGVQWGSGIPPEFHRSFSTVFGQTVLNLFYDRGGAQGTGENVQLECSAEVYRGETLIGTARGEKPILVWAPYYEYRYRTGATDYEPNPMDATSVYTHETDTSYPGGKYFDGKVIPPDFFIQQLGSGGAWSFVQFVDADRLIRYTFGDDHFTFFPHSLDNTFPYDGPWPAGDNHFSTSDSPANGLTDQSYSFMFRDRFYMCQIYVPPAHPAGFAVEWVPLHVVNWEWNTQGDRSIDPRTPWSGPGPEPTLPTTGDTELPGINAIDWEHVLFNQP